MLSFNIVEWLFYVVELLFSVVGLLFNIVVYQILSWHPRIPQNCINMQNGGRTDFNLTKVKIVIICKQIQWRCLHFSKLIPFVCKTLGFTSWNPWFYNLKPRLSDCDFLHIRKHFLSVYLCNKMNIYAKQKSPSLSRLPSPKAANVHNRGWSANGT